jgi:hypothetical protein
VRKGKMFKKRNCGYAFLLSTSLYDKITKLKDGLTNS